MAEFDPHARDLFTKIPISGISSQSNDFKGKNIFSTYKEIIYWFFGLIGREDSNRILDSEDSGVFLVRESSSCKGDLVLCVREDREENKSRVSHYIINKIVTNGLTRYRIGDQDFPDVPSLLSFYQKHYLDTTPLRKVAPKARELVQAKFDFAGKDEDDLPFKRGEILTIITKDEDQWWTARNTAGQKGSIPVPYVLPYREPDRTAAEPPAYKTPDVTTNHQPISTIGVSTQRKLPAMARVVQARVPNAYDNTMLKLEVGDIIKVLEMPMSGQWKGILNGKEGSFPFTHVKFVDDETENSES